MAKFGELISSDIPVLINFHTEDVDVEGVTSSDSVLSDVAVVLGDRAKIIKINIDKNEILVNSLRIKESPTFIIYKNGEMKWRQSGNQNSSALISLVQQYI